jgi:tRNA uridine 5-carboxymethylaminomethyl modification enzyme
MRNLEAKQKGVKGLRKALDKTSVSPEGAQAYLDSVGSVPLKQKVKARQILTRPHVHLTPLIALVPELNHLADNDIDVIEQVEIQVKYEGYIEKEQAMADRMAKLGGLTIPNDLEYSKLASLSAEAKQKLTEKRPVTLGEAANISGVSASDVSVLLIYLGR